MDSFTRTLHSLLEKIRWRRCFVRALALPGAVVLFLLPLALAASETAADEAPTSVEPMASSPPLEAAYQFVLGKMLADESSFDKALEAYEKSLALDGSDPYGRLELARFHAYLAQVSRSRDGGLKHLQEASAEASRAVALARENVEVLRSYAQIKLQLAEQVPGALDEARSAFEELRDLTEGDLQVLPPLAQIYLWQRRPAKAVEVLEDAASHWPEHRIVHTLLLEALLQAGESARAEEVLEKLLVLDGSSLEHRLRLANLRGRRGAHREAIATLEAASPEQAGSSDRLQMLARELHLVGENARALEILETLLEGSPDRDALKRLRIAVLTAMSSNDAAITAVEAALAASTEPEVVRQNTLLLSRLLERVARPDEAVEKLRALVADGKQSLEVELMLIGVLERNGRAEEAIELLHRKLEAADLEELPRLSRALADVLEGDGRVEEALSELDRMIKLLDEASSPESADGLRIAKMNMLAEHERWRELVIESERWLLAERGGLDLAARLFGAGALAESGDLEAALALLDEKRVDAIHRRQALARKGELLLLHGREREGRRLLARIAGSGDAEDLLFAARVYQRAERYGDMVPLLERLLGEDPESSQALFMLGVAQERGGQAEAAIATFRRLLAVEPDHPAALNYLGYMWTEESSKLEEALAMIRRAVALEQDNGAYVDSLGWVYFKLGRYEEARRQLEWAARLVPDDSTIFEHLGDLYVRLEERELALRSYRRAQELGGENLETVKGKLESLGGSEGL